MGARKIIKLFIPRRLFGAVEPYGHLIEAFFYNVINGFPARGMKVIGVTGTNGKTTTSFMIHRMLVDAGYNVGLNSTVAYGINNDIREQVQHFTNVPIPELMRRLKWMKSEKIDWLVLETTSHALAQHRTFGVPYSIAVFTNLTHEHLAYHRTFERYRDAKRRMFKLANKNKRGMRVGVINAEDPNAAYFASDIANPITYGIETGDLQATKVKMSANGSTFTAVAGDDRYEIVCNLPGSFNVSNALAAVAVGGAVGLTSGEIERGIAALESVEGRMVSIDEGQDFGAIVDYAHSPDSFEKLFSDLRPAIKRKLIIVFGSQGGGDTAKRPIQGELAGKYGDLVVICEEDDRNEDPQKIMDEIAAGAEKAGKVRDRDLFLIHNRPEAMAFAVGRARAGDTVLFLGKGHEKTIEDAQGEHPWDETGEVRKAIKALTNK